jgi:hypothetical protein
MQAHRPFRQKQLFAISGLVFLCLVLSGCSSSTEGNSTSLDNYLSTLFTESEFSESNDFAVVDPNESFTLLYDSTGFKNGDSDKSSRANWGEVQTYSPEQCQYENFWSGAPVEITTSEKIKGLAVNFRSINMSVEDFMLSKASLLGQFVLVFESEEVTLNYFSAIAESLEVCTSGVSAKNVDGTFFEVGLKNAPNKGFKYYRNTDVLVRSSQDGLIGLDVFVKTKFSIIFYKIIVNDQNLPNKTSWGALNSLLNDPISRICKIEQCDAPKIDFATIPSFEPSGLVVSKPAL